MIYELRTYEAHEGRGEPMRRRFKEHVVPRLPKHGIELLGVFEPQDDEGRLVYVTRFADEDARQKGWAAFGADPEWKAIKAESEKDGPLLRNQTVVVMNPAVEGLLMG